MATEQRGFISLKLTFDLQGGPKSEITLLDVETKNLLQKREIQISLAEKINTRF